MVKSWWQNRGIPGTRVLVLIAGALLSSAWGSSYTGGFSDAYLRAPIGAEAQALGNANVIAPGYLRSMINPAAISDLSMGAGDISFGGGVRALGRTDGNLSFDLRVLSRLGLGLSVLYRGDPVIDIVDGDEQEVGKASYTTITSKFALSYPISRHLGIGAALGIYYQNLPSSDIYFESDEKAIAYSYAFAVGGIDLGLRYQWRKDIKVAALIQNLFARNDWQFIRLDFGDLQETSSNTFPVALVLAATLERELQGKPFLWHSSLKTYLLKELSFDGIERLDRVSALWSNGWEWRYWKNVALRAGLSDLPLDSDLFGDFETYAENFSAGLGFGAALHLDRVAEGLRVDYAISLNKVLAGVEQQVNIVYSVKSSKRSSQ